MRQPFSGRFRWELGFLRRQFLQDGLRPFADVLSADLVGRTLAAIGTAWYDRIYTPLVTLWLFLGQVLSPDPSCRAAVARLNADRAARGLRPCSARTGAYCQARQRLPERLVAELTRQTGRALDAGSDPTWRWKGRRVYVYDGSHASMPDTPENQAEYPQPDTQKPGLGFPLARLAAVFSLACGAVLDLAIGRYAGKGQSELGMLKQRGIDSVCRLTCHRKADFRRGWRLGAGDHVEWPKPNKPRSIDREAYAALPASLTVRETRVRGRAGGFRTRALVVATTLLHAEAVTAGELAQLYRERWSAGTRPAVAEADAADGRAAVARRRSWSARSCGAHILAYNLIRAIAAQAATEHDVEPRSISFKAVVQTLEAFQPVIARRGEHNTAVLRELYQRLLDAVAGHRVGDRPDRYEPRRRKRRPKPYDRLMKPRHEAKRAILKAFGRCRRHSSDTPRCRAATHTVLR